MSFYVQGAAATPQTLSKTTKMIHTTSLIHDDVLDDSDTQVNTLLSLQKAKAPTALKFTLWKSPFDNILHNSDFHDFLLVTLRKGFNM